MNIAVTALIVFMTIVSIIFLATCVVAGILIVQAVRHVTEEDQ